MSGANFNLVDRVPRPKDPARIKDVFSLADFPDLALAPDGIMRSPLEIGVEYVIHEPFPLPRMLVPRAISLTAFNVNVLRSASSNVGLLFDGTDTPHIWGREVGPFAILDSQCFDIGNGGAGRSTVLLDLVGGTSVSFFASVFSTYFNFKQMGRFVDIAYQFGQLLSSNFESGFVNRVTPGADISHRVIGSRMVQQSTSSPMIKPLYCFLGGPMTTAIAIGNISLNSGDSAICIDSAATGVFSIGGNSYGGPAASGNFFRPDISESLTEMAEAEIAITGFSDSTADPGVDTTVSFGAIQRFTRGQIIEIGDAGAPYDGTHAIVRVAADESSFDINVTFAAPATGNVKITRVTAVGHGLVEGETNTISGTTSYNVTTQTLFVTEDTFDIPVAFVADDATGTVASTSQNETTVGVDVQNNGAQANSKSIGSMHANGNTTATTITTINTWVDLDLDASAVASSNIERWVLTNTTTGELRYEGTRPFNGQVAVNMSGFGQAGQDDYEFRIVVNGSPTSDGIVSGTSTNSQGRNVALLAPISAVTGDLVRPQLQNITGNDDFTFENVAMIIQ